MLFGIIISINLMSVSSLTNIIQAESDSGSSSVFTSYLFIQHNDTDDWSILGVNEFIKMESSGAKQYMDESSTEFYNNYKYPSRLSNYLIPYKLMNLQITQNPTNEFPAKIFKHQKLSDVRSLQITNCRISNFHSEHLSGAKNLLKLNVSGNEIERLPSLAFAEATHIQIIDFSHNHLWSMAPDVFKGLNLKEIYFHNNNLTHLYAEWFKGIDNLEVLTFNNNFLTEIDSNLFFPKISFDASLKLFNISNNDQLNETKSIKVSANYVDISNTNSIICYIGNNVKIMYAHHNRIPSTGILSDILNENLTELYLANNIIDSADFLKNLTRLETIDLSFNFIKNINAQTLSGLFSLKKLILSHNKIKAIDFRFIDHTPNLEYMDLSSNQLGGTFKLKSKANNLMKLYIAGNNFTSFDITIKKTAPNLKVIDLNDNSFNCSELTTIILFLHFDYISTVTKYDPAIASTSNVKGIRCYNKTVNSKEFGISTEELLKSYDAVKDDTAKIIDEKLDRLEAKLFEFLKNAESMTTMANVLEFTKLNNIN